jgi:hypothetical protein
VIAAARRIAFGAACASITACSAAAPSPRAEEPPIVAIWRARCGACHAPVEPGTRGTSALRAAEKRHAKRVHLAPEEWDALVAWLASQRSR